jgi:hypothetical protein
MSEKLWRICQPRSRAAFSPDATTLAGSPGRRGPISGSNSMPVIRAIASMTSRTEMPVRAEVVHAVERPAGREN